MVMLVVFGFDLKLSVTGVPSPFNDPDGDIRGRSVCCSTDIGYPVVSLSSLMSVSSALPPADFRPPSCFSTSVEPDESADHRARPDTGLQAHARFKIAEVEQRIVDLTALREALVDAIDAGGDVLLACADRLARLRPVLIAAGGARR
jgi:hypothetical protein